MFKKLKMWFWTKKRTVQEMTKIDRILKLNLQDILSQMESLDQDRAYICVMAGASVKDMETVQDAFKRANHLMKWTLPQVIMINKELQMMTPEEVDLILRRIKRQKGVIK